MSDMPSIDAAIARLPAELEPGTRNWLATIAERYPEAPLPAEFADRLLRVAAISEFASRMMLKDWPWVVENLAAMDRPFNRRTLAAFADGIEASGAPVERVKKALRQRRHRELFAILWRDLAGLSSVDEGIEALSDTADELLRAAAGFAQAQLSKRFGRVRDGDGGPVDLVIIAMGKLGGRELNFSSDVDVIFAYPDGSNSDGPRSLDPQPYFNRLSRDVVALIDEVTADGFVFRMDTRLRPFGESGPPVISFPALESYLVKHARDWERYAYVKARLVGQRPPDEVRRELMQELILPFVYRRYLDYGVFKSLREMHAKIAIQVQRRDRQDDVKLGPGGIREVEFLVQSLQIVRGGRHVELQSPSLIAVLPRLVAIHAIDAESAEQLLEAYRWLRRIENLIQAVRDTQIHGLPVDETDRARLLAALGFDDWADLRDEFERQRGVVSRQFGTVAFPDQSRAVAGSDYATLWAASASAERWQRALEARNVSGADIVAKRLAGFPALRVTRKADNLARERLDAFIPCLLALAEDIADAATAVDRCLNVVERILRRSAYLALLNENPLAARRLVSLCERSAYIATQIASFPVLLDELLDPRAVSGALTREECRDELAAAIERANGDDPETCMEAIARAQRATMFRIAVADFSDTLPIMKVSDSLTYLAEAVLDATLKLAWDDLARRHGTPHYEVEGKRHAAGFGIVGYGKLGGLELSYGSDLDIVFLHDSLGTAQMTDGDRPIDNTVFFTRLVRRLVHFLGTRTRTGLLYDVDTRLRPSGRKGLLVSSLDAFARYQQDNAWTWEHQALLRARPVAGTEAVGRAFDRIRATTLRTLVRRQSLRNDVLAMRKKMRAELDRSGAAEFDLKQGEGGIGDIEFLVQYLVLDRAAETPSVIDYTDNIRQLDALAACGAMARDDAAALQSIYRRFRNRQHHLGLNDRPALVPATEFTDERNTVSAAWKRYFEA